MKLIPLDPGLPERMQITNLRDNSRGFRRLIPLYSEMAEHAFRQHASMKQFTLIGPKAVVLTSSELRTTVPPDNTTWTVPVDTVQMDPRSKPFNGDPQKLAMYLGVLLSHHVAQELIRLESILGRQKKMRSEVMVFGELPMAQMGPDAAGLRLSEEAPLLRAHIELMFEKA